MTDDNTGRSRDQRIGDIAAVVLIVLMIVFAYVVWAR